MRRMTMITGQKATSALFFGAAFLMISLFPGVFPPALADAAVSGDVTNTAYAIFGGSGQQGYPATNAFNKDLNDVVSFVSSAGTFIGQDFGAPKNIAQVNVYRNGVGSFGFHAKLQYSDDGMLWQDTNLLNIDAAVGGNTWIKKTPIIFSFGSIQKPVPAAPPQ